MGSTPSTPNRESSDNNTGDNPWWQIENQILELNPNRMDATAGDSHSTSNRSETDRPQHEVQSEETETLISANIECENRNTNEDRIDVVSLNVNSENDVANNSERGVHSSERQQSLEEFKEELRIKRELRTNAIVELRNELSSLRRQLAHEKEINKQLIEERRDRQSLCEICSSIYESLEHDHDEECTAKIAGSKKVDHSVAVVHNYNKSTAATESQTTNITLRTHLAEVQFALQNANAEILRITSELAATRQQAKSLKEVIAVSKEIIDIRETELSQLKSKLSDIENSLAEREMHMMSENLRQEYDRQLVNIRNLRALYEERARISAAEKENLNRQIETSRAEVNAAVEKNKNLEEHIESLNADLKSTSTDLYATKEKLAYYRAESQNLYDEMTVVNQLFGQLLAGFNGNNNIDIDKLTAMLEENRDLLNDITSKENCKEGAAQIPKLIFDLVSQADQKSNDTEKIDESPSESSTLVDECGGVAGTDTDSATVVADKVTSAEEISHNLPKVWRVLIELLNHQQLKPVPLKGANQQELCYKSIQTETGPQMVLSVSKTFIRLKDLILEKKFLQKETKKLKNLNSHLECRLGEQEQRLSAVTIELNKTWNLVGRMQRQHRQLHTHEQVLRYQLQQKRRMLNELKEELEYCRRKWALAKEKNNESQSQWESMRLEFRQRKENDLNNSGESGYSDSPASEEDDDDDEEDEVSIVSEGSRNSRTKKKLNIEKFLLTTEQIDRKSLRIHSVSPVRTARMSSTRRNSDSQITTQFATEVCQASSDVVQPLEHLICTECGENCVKHSVHFVDSDAVANVPPPSEQVKVTEPIVCNAVKPKLTNAQKLVEAKATTSKTKMCCEMRKTGAIAKTTPTTPTTKVKAEESLEEMFFRLSGSSEVETYECADVTVSTQKADQRQQDEKDRAARKLAKIEKLEVQCKQLMAQVMRASNHGDELNKRADTAHNKFKLNCNLEPIRPNSTNADESTASTSTAAIGKVLVEPIAYSASQQKTKTDEQCLTQTEQEYLARRDARLTRLEAESQAHLNRMKSAHQRAASVDTKMDSLRKRAVNAQVALAKVEAKFNNIAATISLPYNSMQQNQSTIEANNDAVERREERPKSPGHRAASVDTKLDAMHLEPSTSSSSSTPPKTDDHCLSATEREYLARRDERLKRLEAEANAYMHRVKSTNRRAVDVDTKLEFLHGRYSDESDGAGASAAQPTNESQTAISTEPNNIPSNTEPSNPHDHSETNHSPTEIIPNPTANDENTEDSTD